MKTKLILKLVAEGEGYMKVDCLLTEGIYVKIKSQEQGVTSNKTTA